MEPIHKIERKSNSGSTRRVELIYFEPTDAKSYASYVLLKNYYWQNDADNIETYTNRMKLIGFSRNYLTQVKNTQGSITCTYCNKPNLVIEYEGMKVPNRIKATIDHIVPKSKGGAVFDYNNITPCCGTCNNKKGSMSVEEFLKIVKKVTE